MSNVKLFPGTPKYLHSDEPREDLIKGMELCLSYAKSGELKSFVGIGFLTTGHRLSCIATHDNFYELIGALEMLKQDYAAMMTEEPGE